MGARHAEPSYETTREVRDGCLCLHVQRGARALARRFDAAFRPLELTHGQFSLLMSLNRPEPPTIGAVAALIGMDRTSLTAKLKPLERRRLLRVLTDAGDQRSRRLVLTDEGRALLSRAVPIWRKTHAELNDAVAPKRQADVRAAMNALSEEE
jgi:DNA-binding MarR family transcriptional regulator